MAREDIYEFLSNKFNKERVIKAVVSGTRQKGILGKTEIKPVMLKVGFRYQFARLEGQKVLHENLTPEEAVEKLTALLEDTYYQLNLYTDSKDYQLLCKKGFKVLEFKPTRKMVSLTHDKEKSYILKENTPYDFLVKLGVMQPDGKVKKSMYDKFRQINKYLEFIRDVVDNLDKSRPIKIVDFGCGKAYLSFALYHYLVNELGYELRMIGLDLKDDVIAFGNKLSKELGFEHLVFEKGDIKDFSSDSDIDLVFSLHACDVATDYAIYKALKWNAKVIMAVPCCQKEINPQIQSNELNSLIKHGIHREKLATLVTDSLRASLLDSIGYKTNVMEFIDLEHTPKNVLIRAIKNEKIDKTRRNDEYDSLLKAFKIQHFMLDELITNWE